MLKMRDEDIRPVCPHCKKELDEIIVVKRKVLSVIKVFCCEHCKAILGLSVT